MYSLNQYTHVCICRQAVEDNYNDVRAQIQQQLLEQNEAISTLTTHLRNSKTSGQALSQKVARKLNREGFGLQ